ncbi:MAG TPA: FHA domain-containing protein [Isosphaeraceae bacterium]|nr:FHA domain-containing protein [Isosphaeraceae bacterium]
MKVQLIVVQGKPEGKQIPLAGPSFKIGRGETCHLRPNSELVSREHAEFLISADKVVVKDLGSRNGTLVNGKALTSEFILKNGDLVQVGPLTFAVAIQGVVAPAGARAGANGGKPASLDEAGHDEIESWLIADKDNQTPDRPSGVFAGDTITIKAFKEASAPQPPAPVVPAAQVQQPTSDVTDEEYERLPEGEGDGEEEEPDPDQETIESEPVDEDMPAEFIDESNPFYVKKTAKPAEEGPSKPLYKDTSDAATDILRKMMERRRGSR